MSTVESTTTRMIVFHFEVSVEDLQKGQNEILSPEIVIADVPWKIKLVKKTVQTGNENRDVLCVFLLCLPRHEATTETWSIEAKCCFSLVSFETNQTLFEREMPKTEFRNDISENGLDNFISWNELVNPESQFIQNNEIIIKCKIGVSPMKRFFPSKLQATEANFQFSIQNVKNLNEKYVYSNDIDLRGLKWNVSASKDCEYLSLFLHCSETEKIDLNWSYHVTFSFKLLPFDTAIVALERKCFNNYRHNGMKGWGYKHLIEWSKLMDVTNRYVENDEIVIEVYVKVDPAKPAWRCDETEPIFNPSIAHCPICFETFSKCEISATKCGHLFCTPCIKKTIEQSKKCSICNASANIDELRAIFVS